MQEDAISDGYLFEQKKRLARQKALLDENGDIFKKLRGGLLEIGCGHGHWLTTYAEQNENVFCVGLDLIRKRIRKSQSKADKRELTNIRFLKAEALEFIEMLPDTTRLEKVVVLFPDPWPKKRHHRRRLIQPAFLKLMASKMSDQGQIFFRTDYTPYFEWAVEEIEKHPDWQLNETFDWPMERSTYFQELMTSYQSLSATAARK